MEEYESWNDFLSDTHPTINGLSKKTHLEKGCLIQLLPKHMIGNDDKLMCLYNAKYIYPPKLHMSVDEIQHWISDEVIHFHENELSKSYMIDKIIYWRFVKVACNLIKANKEWFESKISQLKQFWEYILFYRKHPNKLNKIEEFIKEVGKKNSSEIFAKIHKDFISINKNSNYKPLYQKETEWRKIYVKKYGNYQKFIDWKNNKEKNNKENNKWKNNKENNKWKNNKENNRNKQSKK
jgi:hypothetical protein